MYDLVFNIQEKNVTRTFYVVNSVPVLGFSEHSRTLSLLRTMILAQIFSVPVPVPHLKNQPVPCLFYAPKNQHSPVPRTFSVPVLRYGYVDGYGIRTRTSGYDSNHHLGP